MQKRPSKSQIREEIERQITEFIAQGGAVDEVPRGISGRDPGDPPVRSSEIISDKPRESRTLVPEVVAAIEARRKPAKEKPKTKRPKKKLIYDDFGEPLRWEWVEE